MKALYCWTILALFFPLYAFALQLTPLENKPYYGDLDELDKKGVIRVLVSNDLGFYYVEGGRPKGIIAEVLHQFEKEIKKKHAYLNVQIIPVTRDELIPSLEAGFGDIIAANLTKTPSREAAIDFSNPTITGVKELIITHSSKPDLTSFEQLSGKEIWIRPSSSYFESITKVNHYLSEKNLAPVLVQFLEEALQDYEIIELVNQNYIYATVLDSHKSQLWQSVMDNIKPHEGLPLREDAEIGWAFRKNSPKLEKELNKFLRSAKLGTLLGNVLYDRYIEHSEWLTKALSPKKIDRMRTLADVFEKYSEQYQFDWLMISLLKPFRSQDLIIVKYLIRGPWALCRYSPQQPKIPM